MLISLLIESAKRIGGPGSVGFLAVGSAIGLIGARFRPSRRVARRGLLILFTSHVLLGVPAIARQLADRLPSYSPRTDYADFNGRCSLIILGGDNTRGRVREAGKIFSAIQPSRVLISGDADLVLQVIAAGVPRNRVMHDPMARTTRDQILRATIVVGPEPSILVTSRLQSSRVAALIQAAGLPALIAPSPVDDEPPSAGWRLYLPTYLALRVSRDAIYEHAAGFYYRRKGWIGREPVQSEK